VGHYLLRWNLPCRSENHTVDGRKYKNDLRPVHSAYGNVPGVVPLFCDRARPHRILHFNVTRHQAATGWCSSYARAFRTPSLCDLDRD